MSNAIKRMISRSRSSRGYTLIEMAVVMTVVGVLAGSFFSAYNLYLKEKIRRTTELNASLVTSSLSSFLTQNGRYPCPARADALRTDADYGIESQCDPDPAKTGYPSTAPGNCANGLCVERSTAWVTINNYLGIRPSGGIGCYTGSGAWGCPGSSGTGVPPAKITIQPFIRRGAVPFRTLAISEDRAMDGFGNRFWYAVTENQAVSNAYENGNGGIEVLNAAGQQYFNVTMRGNGGYLRPDADITKVSFNPTTGTLYSKLNESTLDSSSTSIAYSTAGANPATLEFSLTNPVGTPLDGTVKFRYTIARTNSTGSPSGGSAVTADTQLLQGTTVLAEDLAKALGNSWTTNTLTFDTTQVTDWNDLWVRFKVYGGGTGGGARGGGIAWAEVELPNGGSGYQDYFVFSTGNDKAGSYSRWAKMTVPCATGTLDATNCATKATATYRLADRNDAPGANHFDDFAKFFSATETPLWQIKGTGAHIRDLLPSGGKVGIAQSADPGDPALLQVGGEVRANNANALMTKACGYGTTKSDCFVPDKLGTADPTFFQCPAGEYAVGFEAGKIKCAANQIVRCALGQMMVGVNPDGSLICQSAVGCPATNADVCVVGGVQETRPIPAGIQGQEFTTTSSGYNYTETWRCGPNPWWEQISSSGICDCTPIDTTYTNTCAAVLGGYYSGDVTYHRVHICPENTETNDEVSRNCLCENDGFREEVVDYDCPSGFTGTITRERFWNCTSATTGEWTPWTDVVGGNACTCNAQTLTQSLSCDVGWTGVWEQENEFECPAGTWTGWTDVNKTCACQDGFPQEQNAACPSGYTGYMLQRRTLDCATNTFSTWADIENHCDCTPTSETQTLACNAGYSGAITKRRDFTCPPAWTDWYTTTDTACTCTGATEYRSVSCDSPLVGTKEQVRTYDCGTDAWTGWTDTGNDSCAVVTYNWRAKTAAEGPYPDALTIKAGDSCTDPTLPRQPCASRAGGGNGWYHYAECQCE
jgi:prepilin-type N-terminal cleavage/methylation domain-containing protein